MAIGRPDYERGLQMYGQQIWNDLYGIFNADYIVAAIMGNWAVESLFIPYIRQGHTAYPYTYSNQYTQKIIKGEIKEYNFVNSGDGYGLAQWTYPTRKQNLYTAAKNSSGGLRNISDLHFQIDFACNTEMKDMVITYQGESMTIYEAITEHCYGLSEVNKIIHIYFENPADKSQAMQDLRREIGEEILYMFKGSYNGSLTPQYSYVERKEDTDAPESGNKYYTRAEYGGINECIGREQGLKNPAWRGSVLPNCVGYAWGRAAEMTGGPVDLSINSAYGWFQHNKDLYDSGAGGYPYAGVGSNPKPRVGAIGCFSHLENGEEEESGGHVYVVEEVLDESTGKINTSNSAYNGSTFFMSIHTPSINDGQFNYDYNSYRFKGFIYVLDGYNPSFPPLAQKIFPCVNIYVDGQIKKAIPYVYTVNKDSTLAWKKTCPMLYTKDKWHEIINIENY